MYNPIYWPTGKFKGFNIRKIPVAYLNWFLRQPIGNSYWIQWRNKAVEELQRRHSLHSYIHFSEHSIERFTQYWPRFITHYQKLVDKEAGLITLLRKLFLRALENGLSYPASDDKNKLIVLDHKYKWVYCTDLNINDNVEHFKVITIGKIK